MSALSWMKTPKAVLLALSLFAIPVYAACEEADQLNTDATYNFTNRSNSLSIVGVNGTSLNATIMNQRAWSVNNHNWYSAAAASNFANKATYQYNGHNPVFTYDTVAYCEVVSSLGNVLLRKGRSYGNSGALNNLDDYSGFVYMRNINAPESSSFCDFNISSLSEGNYTLRFGKGRAWRTDWKMSNGNMTRNYFFDRQENLAATAPFFIDRSAPSGGALTVNNVTATPSITRSYNTTGSFLINSRTDYTDSGSGLNSQGSVLTRSIATLSNNICGSFSQSTNLSGAPEQWGLNNNCYRYKLSATNNFGLASAITTIVKIDKSAPTGGSVASPESSPTGDFDLLISNFSDAESGMRSNVLQRRNAPFESDGECPSTADNAAWGAWQNTGFQQRSLAPGCWDYRLTGTNNAGSSNVSRSVTSAGAPDPTARGKLTILSMSGPKRAKLGKRVVYTVKIQNTGDRTVSVVSSNAAGYGVKSNTVNSGSVFQQSRKKVKISVRFKKKGWITLSLLVKGDRKTQDRKSRVVRVR